MILLFQMENRELNRNCLLSVPADVAGGNLSVRRVSDISHLNEMRHQGRTAAEDSILSSWIQDYQMRKTNDRKARLALRI